MRNWIVLSLILALAAGCTSAPATPTIASSENREEQIQKFLIGTWTGDIKDSTWHKMVNSGVTLQISEVREDQSGWTINAFVNWQSPEYIKLLTYNGTITLKIMDRYGGLYTLSVYKNKYLLGNVIYDRGFWKADPHDLVLKKI